MTGVVSTRSYVATGNVFPCRFVAQDGAFKCKQAVANDIPIGISQSGGKYAPNTAADNATSGVAAEANDPLRVHGLGEECLLELGGTVTAGARLGPDANGRGVAETIADASANLDIGAIALEGGASGQRIRVQVVQYQVR